MKKSALFLLLLFIVSGSLANRIKLSTVSIDLPAEVTKGNKVTVTNAGLSQYAWNRLRNDSSTYYYTYSFKYTNGLFEFRETTKEDIYEWHESVYPRFKKRKEQGYYNEKAFLKITNPVLKDKLWGITNETKGKIRKITVIYKFNKTTQFIASLKTAYNPAGFLAMQDSLIHMLETVEIDQYVAPKHEQVEQSGELKDMVKHFIIDLPIGLSNDFNNPVVEQTKNGDLLVAYAHSTGSEIFRIGPDMKIKHHYHFDKIVHDIIPYGEQFFTLASTDYNKLTWGIYPTLYLSKHQSNCEVMYWNRVFKNQKLRFPGNQVFDYYSRDNVCGELVDSIGLVYCNSELKFSDLKVGQAGAYKLFSTVTGIKKKADQDLWHVSHCFAQKSIADDRNVYLFSIGDNDPRSLCLSKIDVLLEKDSLDSTSFFHLDLYKIDGTPGDNYVQDSHISNPVFFHNKLYILLETESGAKTDFDNNALSSNRGHNDLFLISCTKDGKEIDVKQITKTKHIEEVDPKLVVHNDALLLLYTEVKYSKTATFPTFEDVYLYVDERGSRKTTVEPFNTIYVHEDPKDWKMPDSPINRDGNDLVRLSDGSVIWIRLLKNTRQLECVRISDY